MDFDIGKVDWDSIESAPPVEEIKPQPKKLDPITTHHLRELESGGVPNDDGSVSTVRTLSVDFEGVPTLVPTVWDGKILSNEEAIKRARDSGIKWPTAKTHEELRAVDKKIHERFDDDLRKSRESNLVSPTEDKQIEALHRGATPEEASLNGKLPVVRNIAEDVKTAQVEQAQRLRPTLNEAIKVNPDKFIETKRLSDQTGLPSAVIEADPDSIKRTQQLDSIDFYDMAQKNPATYEHLSQYENAAAIHDDIPATVRLENTISKWKDINQKMSDRNIQYFRDIDNSVVRGSANVDAFELHTKDFMSVLFDTAPLTDEDMQRLTDLSKIQNTKRRTDLGFFTGAPLTAAEQLPILWDITKEGVKGAGAGALLTGGVPALAAAFATGGPGAIPTFLAAGAPGAKIGGRIGVAKAAFELEGGAAFSEFSIMKDDDGNVLDREIAAQASFLVGAVNAGLESLSIVALGRTVTPALRYALRNRVKQALLTETGRDVITRIAGGYMLAMGAEGVTESIQEFTTLMGGALAQVADPESFKDMSAEEVVDILLAPETWDRVGEAGAMGLQASMVFGSVGTTTQVYQHNSNRLRLAENEILQLDAINESASEAKLKERSPEKFRDFVEQADGENNTHVFIDGDLATLYLQGKTDEEINADPALKLIKDKLEESSSSDTDISVPVADFATDIAGTDHLAALKQGMTLNEETVNPFRQGEARASFEGYMSRLTDRANENVSQYVEAQALYKSVVDQLVDTGQVSPQNAGVMAKFVPAYMTVFAKERGLTLEQAFTRYGFRVEGPQTGEMARLSAEALTQEPAYADAPLIFDNAKEKFLSILPEDADMDEVMAAVEEGEFSPEYKNFIKALDRDDWLGFDYPSQAISAALSGDINDWSPSQGLKSAIGRMINSDNDVFRQEAQETHEWSQAVARGLDMSHDARMLRAHEQGYNIVEVMLHGTKSDIESFDESTFGDRDGGFLGKGAYLTSSPHISNFYAKSAATNGTAPNTLRLFTRVKKTKDIRVVEKTDLGVMLHENPKKHAALIQSWKDEGYDGVRVIDASGAVIELAVFNPSQIRSVNAAFDPDYTDSNNLLAQPLSATQDFGDATISEKVEIEGTKEPVTITQSAQKVFDDTMKRRNVVDQILRCLNA